MFIRNSLALAFCIYFLCIKFGDSSAQDLDRLDGNEGVVNEKVILRIEKVKNHFWYLGEFCFFGSTQQEGICKEWYECETPCSRLRSGYLSVTCKRGMVCCPLTKDHPSISAASNFLLSF